ncbi:MAG: hypothetical protein ABR600_13700 [Actinomycetota bacterium]
MKWQRLALAFSLVAVLVSSLSVAAAAAPAATQARGTLAGPALDLSTMHRIQSYLRALGVDPATAIVERGARNYAGPRCPGAGWNCAGTTRPVIQIGTVAGGVNRFVARGGTSATVVQVAAAPAVTNTYTCTDEMVCTTTQTNTTGTNKATVRQKTTRKGDQGAQLDKQHADIVQTNDSGDNIVDISQSINQDLNSNGTPVVLQDQQAFQDVSGAPVSPCDDPDAGLCQQNGSGDNRATIDQYEAQSAHANGTSITQCQNTADGSDIPGCQHPMPMYCPTGGDRLACPNQLVVGEQDSDSGRNTADVDQDINQDEHATGPTDNTDCVTAPAPGICQQESNREGGMEIDHAQLSTGISRLDTSQVEHQTLKAPKGICGDCQFAFGPMSKPANQDDNPNDRIDIEQFSSQSADPGAQLDEFLEAECSTSGICHIDQEVRQNNDKFVNPDHCDAMFCDQIVECFSPASEGPACDNSTAALTKRRGRAVRGGPTPRSG